MAFTKYIVPVKHQGRTFSPSIVIKDGKVLVNKLMAQYLQLDKHRSYDVYVDPERKLIGIDVGKGFTYTVRSKENAPTHSLVAVAQALKDAGCNMPKAAVIAFESGKSLPPPCSCNSPTISSGPPPSAATRAEGTTTKTRSPQAPTAALPRSEGSPNG
jgi:hypothetical protein